MKGFFEKLVKACPSLPFLALGVWLAWAYIACSGTAWLSDTEMNGANISTMYIVFTLTFGIVLLASTFRAARIRQLLERPAVVIAGGAFASLGCLVIVLIGPYYLTKVLPYDLITALFYIASACTGLGTAVVGLKCGQLYGAIAPRKAILYTALSHVAIAVIYFTVIGSPSWQPVPGGPSLAGILAFVGMPLAAAGAAALSFIAPLGEKAERAESRSRFPRSFWKLMAAVVALIAFCPIVGVTHLGWSALVTFLSAVFEFVLWCILAFVVYQRHISAVLVFGFGYGAFMAGSGAGWLAGVHVFPQIAATGNSIVLYLVLAFAVLACAFVLFSEKEFDRLFKPEGEAEASLNDLLGDELPGMRPDDADAHTNKKGRFGLAIDALADQAGLSRREKDVLRCLAMGYDAGAAAKRLQVSWNTVRTHTRNVYAKLDIHSRQELIDLVDRATERTQER